MLDQLALEICCLCFLHCSLRVLALRIARQHWQQLRRAHRNWGIMARHGRHLALGDPQPWHRWQAQLDRNPPPRMWQAAARAWLSYWRAWPDPWPWWERWRLLWQEESLAAGRWQAAMAQSCARSLGLALLLVGCMAMAWLVVARFDMALGAWCQLDERGLWGWRAGAGLSLLLPWAYWRLLCRLFACRPFVRRFSLWQQGQDQLRLERQDLAWQNWRQQRAASRQAGLHWLACCDALSFASLLMMGGAAFWWAGQACLAV